MFTFSSKYPFFRVVAEPVERTFALELMLRTQPSWIDADERVPNPLKLNIVPNIMGRFGEVWVDPEGNFTGGYVRIQDEWPDAEDAIREVALIAAEFPTLEAEFLFYEGGDEYAPEAKYYLGSVVVKDGAATVSMPPTPDRVITARPSGIKMDEALEELGWV